MRARNVETALVTGAGSGMGRAVSLELGLRRGIEVAAADLDLAAAEETALAIRAGGGRCMALRVDVARSESVGGLFTALRAAWGRLDMLVHAAGVLGCTGMAAELTDEDWHHVISIDLDGTFYCCREAVRWMQGHQTGRIVLISSIGALSPMPGAIHYAAAKAGVNMIGKTLAKEVARHNVRVNVIAPGYVDTPLIADLPEEFMSRIVAKTPLKRLADPEEVAGLVSFLATPEADFFTGQVLSPNGGLVI